MRGFAFGVVILVRSHIGCLLDRNTQLYHKAKHLYRDGLKWGSGSLGFQWRGV